jgi:hypothetical protein
MPRPIPHKQLTCLGCFSSISHRIVILPPACRGSEAPHRFIPWHSACGAESKDLGGAFFTHAVQSFSTTSPIGWTSLSLGQRTKKLLASCSHQARSQQIQLSGFGGRKAPNSMGEKSTAEVLRLRATSAVPRDQSVRRSAPTASRGRQDDDSVGELTERRPLCGSRGALQIPRLRSGREHCALGHRFRFL